MVEKLFNPTEGIQLCLAILALKLTYIVLGLPLRSRIVRMKTYTKMYRNSPVLQLMNKDIKTHIMNFPLNRVLLLTAFLFLGSLITVLVMENLFSSKRLHKYICSSLQCSYHNCSTFITSSIRMTISDHLQDVQDACHSLQY